MTVVDRVLVMNFNKLPRAIINLLIKSHRCLVGVNLFHVPGLPSLPALHIEPISPSTRGEAFPMGKFPFILFTRTHRMSIDPEVSILSSVLIPGLRDISQWLDPKTPFPGSGDWTGQGKRLPDRHRLNTQHSGPSTSWEHCISPSEAGDAMKPPPMSSSNCPPYSRWNILRSRAISPSSPPSRCSIRWQFAQTVTRSWLDDTTLSASCASGST